MKYWLARLGGSIANQGRREEWISTYRRLTHWTPPYFHAVRTRGVTDAPRSQQLIVSLTTYPARIGTIHRTLATLLNQSLKPDKLILWLAREQFPNREADLPARVTRLLKYGLEIRWCEDLRSYKKLIPALIAFPEDIIVTADDDLFYGPDWLEKLYASYRKDPSCVHCHLAAGVNIVDGVIQPFATWRWSKDCGLVSYRLSLLGGEGALYPPHSLHSDVMDVAKFQRLSPNADDLWFWSMAVLSGTRVRLVEGATCCVCIDRTADTSQALFNRNGGEEQLNDVQLRNIFADYPIVLSRVLDERPSS